jgi:hypothetical protein
MIILPRDAKFEELDRGLISEHDRTPCPARPLPDALSKPEPPSSRRTAVAMKTRKRRFSATCGPAAARRLGSWARILPALVIAGVLSSCDEEGVTRVASVPPTESVSDASGAAIAASVGRTQTLPGIDGNSVMNNPDKFAWDLFIEINRPALAGKRGVPDPAKKHGDPGTRVWETWKITTPNGSEVFLPKGQRPPAWDVPQIKSLSGSPKKFFSPPKFAFGKLDLAGKSSHQAFRSLPKLSNGNQESRINQPGFEFIVREGLYSIDGQERFRETGRAVTFPVDAIAIKATWRQFTGDEIKAGLPARFYTAQDEEGKIAYGLTGFHMTSKALPNWFWATFEQVNNPPPEVADRDRYTPFRNPRDPNASGVDQRLRDVPEPLKNTVWQYYVLRGTQVEFVDSMGSPTILGNTQLEGGMQSTSSCMGCHARATIGDRVENVKPGTYFFPGGRLNTDGANRLTVDPLQLLWQQDPQKPNRDTAVFVVASANGAPNPDLFVEAGTGRTRYTQLDFLWEFIFAQREAP